jgi:predicted nucleotidyltransferase
LRKVTAVDDLNLPDKHKKFITEFLSRARQISSYDKITQFVLFGSCARGVMNSRSDVDIMVIGDGIGDETLFELYDCTWWPELEKDGGVVNNDIVVNDQNYFNERSTIVGSLQWRVAKDGVIIDELL